MRPTFQILCDDAPYSRCARKARPSSSNGIAALIAFKVWGGSRSGCPAAERVRAVDRYDRLDEQQLYRLLTLMCAAFFMTRSNTERMEFRQERKKRFQN